MRLPHRGRAAAAVLPLVLILSGVGPPGQAAEGSAISASDPTGDVKSTTGSPMEDSRADIVESSATYRQDSIVFRVKTAEPIDPLSDPNWNAIDTTVGFGIDTNGDFGTEQAAGTEYEIEYFVDNGQLVAEVYPPGGLDVLCQAGADYTNGFYKVTVDRNCIGSPDRFNWFAVVFYDRDPADDASPLSADKVPSGNNKFAGTVTFPSGSGSDPGPGTNPDPGSHPDPGTNPDPGQQPPAQVPGPGQGYWLVARDGGIFSYGDAKFLGSTGNLRLNQPIVGMTARPDGQGYWFVAADGGIFAFNAPFYGSTGNLKLSKPIVGMAATPSGRGYWLVANDGGIFAFGDAQFYGSTGNIRLSRPIVGMSPTPSGHGYWLVASDGGIFAFGDAGYYGSTGNIPLNRPIVGMASSPTGKGYLFVANDGGVFAFGDAKFHGSAGRLTHPSPVVGMSMTKDGGGYRILRADGTVAHYGNSVNKGSMQGKPLMQPMVGMATLAS